MTELLGRPHRLKALAAQRGIEINWEAAIPANAPMLSSSLADDTWQASVSHVPHTGHGIGMHLPLDQSECGRGCTASDLATASSQRSVMLLSLAKLENMPCCAVPASHADIPHVCPRMVPLSRPRSCKDGSAGLHSQGNTAPCKAADLFHHAGGASIGCINSRCCTARGPQRRLAPVPICSVARWRCHHLASLRRQRLSRG